MLNNITDQIIVRNWEPSAADPARLVGASCASTLWAVVEKSTNENWENSVNTLAKGQHRAEPLEISGTCRDYAPDIRKDEEIVRPVQQCTETSRNDSSASNRVTHRQFQVWRDACSPSSCTPPPVQSSQDRGEYQLAISNCY